MNQSLAKWAAALALAIVAIGFGVWLATHRVSAGQAKDVGREDPLVSFHFGLEVQGMTSGYFTALDGLGSENEVAEQKVVSEKGVQIVLKVPGRLKFTDATLTRGMTSNMDLWTWRQMIVDGNVKGARKNCSIIMYDHSLKAVAQWDLKNAWPSKLQFVGADAAGKAITAEQITLTYEDMDRKK